MVHPHIVPVFDSGTAVGRLWYVMPYIRGESLRARLVRARAGTAAGPRSRGNGAAHRLRARSGKVQLVFFTSSAAAAANRVEALSLGALDIFDDCGKTLRMIGF